MNRLRNFSLALPAMAGLLLALQPVAGQSQAPAAAPAAGAQPALVMLVAKFSNKESTRNGKVGDTISAKTVKPGKLPDGTEIPKGSKITGKIADVKSKKEGGGDALMTFRLDQVEVKGGPTVPIHGLVIAIGPPMAPKDLFGANSVMARNTNTQGGTGVGAGAQGTGSSNGMDPNTGLGTAGAKDEDDIRLGSTLDSVALGRHMDADWTTVLKGLHSEIDLDSDVVIKVQVM